MRAVLTALVTLDHAGLLPVARGWGDLALFIANLRLLRMIHSNSYAPYLLYAYVFA